MKITIALIRSGNTWDGRQQGRGLLDLPDRPLQVSERERLALRAGDGAYTLVSRVYCSTFDCALETARIIYPGLELYRDGRLDDYCIGEDNCGDPQELRENESFTRWLGRGELSGDPPGESPHKFAVRCSFAARGIMADMASTGIGTAAIITHRMVIITMLDALCIPKGHYVRRSIACGGGYLLSCDSQHGTMEIIGEL